MGVSDVAFKLCVVSTLRFTGCNWEVALTYFDVLWQNAFNMRHNTFAVFIDCGTGNPSQFIIDCKSGREIYGTDVVLFGLYKTHEIFIIFLFDSANHKIGIKCIGILCQVFKMIEIVVD